MTRRTKLEIVASLPDDRLVHYSVHDWGTHDRYRAPHMHPELARDWLEFTRHMGGHPTVEYVPNRRGDPPELSMWIERVDPDLLPLRTLAYRVRQGDEGMRTLFFMRSDMISKELADEINSEAPHYMGAYRLKRAPEAQAEPDPLDRFDAI